MFSHRFGPLASPCAPRNFTILPLCPPPQILKVVQLIEREEEEERKLQLEQDALKGRETAERLVIEMKDELCAKIIEQKEKKDYDSFVSQKKKQEEEDYVVARREGIHAGLRVATEKHNRLVRLRRKLLYTQRVDLFLIWRHEVWYYSVPLLASLGVCFLANPPPFFILLSLLLLSYQGKLQHPSGGKGGEGNAKSASRRAKVSPQRSQGAQR